MRAAFDFSAHPLIVIWEVTRACALACRHCRADAIPCAHPEELTPAESFLLIDQIARANPAVLVLTGGDPMHREDLVPLVERASGAGLRVALSPSATPRFLASDLTALRKAGVHRVSMSIDGATREKHDAFRGVPGTWDWTMEAVAKIRRADLELQINTTFTRQNIGDFDAFEALLRKLDPVLWSVFQLVPTGQAQQSDLLTGEEMETLFLRLWELSRTVPFDIKTTEGQHYRRVAAQQDARHGIRRQVPPVGVNDGRGFVFVSHTGEVYPSGFLPLSAGNVRRGELLDFYRHAPVFQQLRNEDGFGGKCGYCEFRRLCGGSRARAYAMTGDPLASEPLCTYQPERRGSRHEFAHA
ncbi:MAG: radical SAM protein [Verrucomicrobiales bacterium]